MYKRVFIATLVLFYAMFLSQNNLLSANQNTGDDFDNKLMDIMKLKDLHRKAFDLEGLLSSADPYERFLVLTYLPSVELKINETEKASSYAKELLYLSKKFKEDWNYGNAQHSANTALGLVAIKENKIAEAKRYLAAAGDSNSSPQLKTFGPSMVLANALLERGEKDCVIEYLNKLKKIWKYNDGRLDSWISSIKGGGKPYFGANLEW